MNDDMAGKICLLTGANGGIGKETALGLAQGGATVIMVSRDRTKGEEARREVKLLSGNPNIDLLLADLSSLQSIRQLADEFQRKYSQLDVLINNAGNMFAQRQISTDGFEMTFAINYLAPFLLTNLLLATLKASAPARIVNVSSTVQTSGSFDLNDLQTEKRKYSTMWSYTQSKIALILFTYALAKRLEGTGVTVNCLHPGTIPTDIWLKLVPRFMRPLTTSIAKLFVMTPEEGARTSLYLATSPEVANLTGKYFDKCQPKTTTPISYDATVQQRLWDSSMELTQLSVSV